MSESNLELEKLKLERHRIELDAELRRAELDEKRAARELEGEVQSQLNTLKRSELDGMMGKGLRLTAAQATAVAAVLAIIGSVAAALVQSDASKKIESAKNQLQAQIEAQKIVAENQKAASEQQIRLLEAQNEVQKSLLDKKVAEEKINSDLAIAAKNAQANFSVETTRAQAALDLQQRQFESTLISDATKSDDVTVRLSTLKFYIDIGLIKDPNKKLLDQINNLNVPSSQQPPSSTNSASVGSGAALPPSNPGSVGLNSQACPVIEHWTYSQSTGTLCYSVQKIGVGYSGNGPGVNNPLMEAVANSGPIPRGMYTIGPAQLSTLYGPFVMDLIPDPGSNMFGRGAFQIHGSSALGEADKIGSNGSVILLRAARELIASNPNKILEVVQ